MRKISLDLDQIKFSLSISGDVEKIMYDSSNTFETAIQDSNEALSEYKKAAQETLEKIDSSISYIDSLMAQIGAKEAHYQSILRDTKDSEIIEFCEAMIDMCINAYKELEKIIDELRKIYANVKQKRNQTNHSVSNNINSSNTIQNNNIQTLVVMKDFCKTLNIVADKATFITNFQARKIKDYSQIDKQFHIDNKHNSFNYISTSSGNSSFSSNSSSISRIKSKNIEEELLIKEKDAKTFFSKITDEAKIKMPSASLHKLGGKDFIVQMNNLGYEIVKQENDSIIDSKGMIHWEKKDVC